MNRGYRRLLSLVGFLGFLAAPSQARAAVTEEFCSFGTPLTTFTLNQNAFVALGSELRLTDAVASETGSAWYNTAVPLAANVPFHAHFTFRMGPAAVGGDGMAFVLQNSAAGAAALGAGALQMGYGGITPSVVIQFNTYKNDANDPNANNVSLMVNGVATAVPTATGTPTFTMAGGGVLNGWFDYDGAGTISVYVAQSGTKPATPILSHALNLVTQLGSSMYVGFTAATGTTAAETNEHDVYELEFSTAGIPCTCEGDSACSGATPACAASGLCATCSATNQTECTGGTTVCDVPVNKCVGCLTSATCADPTPICDATALLCRACSSNADCSGGTPECATTGANSGDCVICTANANCPPATPRCTTGNTCVQCLSAADCGGDTPICNAGVCHACASDANCGGTTPACEVWGACGQCSATNGTACTGGTGVCDYPSGTCVACEFNSDCSGSSPTCNTTTHTCKPCATNADCAGNPGGQACQTTGMKAGSCVICAVDSDCPTMAAPKCDTTANECVACLTSADCSGATPECNSSNLCVGCLTSADCSGATPVCDPTSSQCKACQNDYAMTNPGPLSCPTAALGACQPAATALAGQCALCSSIDNSACVTLTTTPVCIPSTATCGCVLDTDCNADSYCDISSVATGVCTAGCRTVDGGATNCSTGKYCSQTGGAVGTCTSEPCNSNTDCKAPNGVCDTIAQPHVCVQCLNNPDCPGNEVCDATNHCVACTSTETQNCLATGSGSACLASETCGCSTDTSCGGASSGRVCNGITHVCVAGCRGTGGNGCPATETCSSTTGSAGTCMTVGVDSGMPGKPDAGSGVDAGPVGHVVSQSAGCGCRIGTSSDGRMGALAGALVGLAMAAHRRRKRDDNSTETERRDD